MLAEWRFALSARMTKRHSILLTPIVILVLAGLVYTPLNHVLLVKGFGCGCKREGINANHITTGVFMVALLASIIGTCMLSGRLQGWKRWTYLAAGVTAEMLLCNFIIACNIWL